METDQVLTAKSTLAGIITPKDEAIVNSTDTLEDRRNVVNKGSKIFDR
jgi:hypothetical protein